MVEVPPRRERTSAPARVQQSAAPAERLESLLGFETLIADLSSRFINLRPGDMDAEIEDALHRVCEFLGIDMAVLWQWSGETPDSVIVPTHTYCVENDLRPSEPMREDQYPWARQQVLAGRMFALSSLEQYPAEAAVDRETCRRFGIKAGVCLPLSVGGERSVGVLGLTALRAEREWPDALVDQASGAIRLDYGGLDQASGAIRLDYGGADTCLALATAQLSELLSYLRECPAPTTGKRKGMTWSE